MPRVLALGMAVLLAAMAPPSTAYADVDATVLYASPAGGGDICTLAAPCSLAGAQARARELSIDMTTDTVVNLLGGEYHLTEPWTFSASAGDSGTNGHDLVYQADAFGTASAARPVISGGRVVTGWSPHAAAKNIWRAEVAGLETRQLYVNGFRASRPSRGAGIPGTSIVETATGYVTDDPSPQSWSNKSDIEFVYGVDDASPRNQWAEPRCPVADITGTVSAATITMAQPCFSAVKGKRPGGTAGKSVGLPTDVENDPAVLMSAAEPGTFYLDRSVPGSHVLYYVPRPGEDLRTANVVAPVLETVLSIRGTAAAPVHNVRFKGLSFADTTWLTPSTGTGFPEVSYNVWNDGTWPDRQIEAGVHVVAGHDLLFERDTFLRLGGAGLTLDSGSRNNTLVGNVFHDISGNGVQVGNVDRDNTGGSAQVTGNVITNNYIHDIGREYPGAYAIWNALAQHTTVTHNEIAHLPRGGIASNYHWSGRVSDTRGHRFAYNHVWDYMNVMKDGGGFDTNGTHNGLDGTAPNSELTGNVFHDDHNRYGQIYFDLWTSGFTLRNNVAYASDSLDYNTLAGEAANAGQPCCNEQRYNFYSKDPALAVNGRKYMFDADMVVGNAILAPEAIPASILARAGLQPAYRDLLPDATGPLPENEPPTAPGAATAGTVGAGPSVTLSWTAATDNVGVTGYEVDDGDTVVAAVPASQTTATVNGLVPGGVYELVVRARDRAGNLSAAGNSVRVTVPGGSDVVGHWPFDTVTSGRTADASGGGNPGTVTGATLTAGRIGNGLQFDGTDSISMGNAPLLNQDRHSFTVAASFKAQGDGWSRIVSKGHWGDSSGYALWYDSGRITFGVGANGRGDPTKEKDPLARAVLVSTPQRFGDGVWHHAVAVVDRQAQTVTVYVDGSAQPLTTSTAHCGTVTGTTLRITGCPMLAASSNYPFTIGSHAGTYEHFTGAIDDVHIYPRALAATEIHDATFLSGHWPFDAGSGTRTWDRTGNALPSAATVAGATWVPGRFGQALSFNGVDSYVTMGNSPSLNHADRGFTIAVWFRNTQNGWQRMVTKGHWGNSPGYLLQYNSGAVSFGVGADGTAANATLATTPHAFNDGAWHNAAAVVDRGARTIMIYVDGVAQPLASSGYCGVADGVVLRVDGCTRLNATSTDAFTVGAYHTAARTTEVFTGALDDVRVYARPLAEADIDRLLPAAPARSDPFEHQ